MTVLQQNHFETSEQPPSCNTGVHRLTPLAKFDWYQAVFEGAADEVAALFLRDFGGDFMDDAGRHSYQFGQKHSEMTVLMMWGGQNTGIYLQVSGQESDDVAQWIRRNFPDHRVSRADVALDYRGQSIDHFYGLVEPIARKAKAKVEMYGDPDPSYGNGRTYYFGSRTSDVMLRVYEKGLEQRAKGVEDSPEDWVRFEGQFRPRKDRKAKAARWTPEEFFTMGKWANEAANEVAGLSGTYQPDESIRKNKDEETFEFFLRQYTPLIRRMVEKRGWLGFCRLLFVSVFTPAERLKMETDGRRETVTRSPS